MKTEENEAAYIRVGVTLFKTVQRPTLSGEFRDDLIPWSYEALRQDFGKNNLPNIEKYDGACVIPEHVNYQRTHGKYINMYEPISHQPAPGEFPKIKEFLNHIFGEHIELGLDYLELLYLRPRQMLPILLLVSTERQTGKTTFLRFLKSIFGKNATFNNNEDFRSQFNADWANRLLVMVDELLLNKNEDTEKIKNLSTAGDYKIEAKGKDRHEIEFFAKFVLCSNNELNPIIIPREEVRFWVRKINPVKKDNTELLRQMEKEIPQFLYFLKNRELHTKNESRMWFNPKLLETVALLKIKKYNASKTELEIAHYCSEVYDVTNNHTVQCCPKDLLEVVQQTGIKSDCTQIRTILRDQWNIHPNKNSGHYIFYKFGSDGELIAVKGKGRYYEISREFIDRILL
jgi:hypothetical protein